MSSASPIRIVIADDHALFREGLRGLLEAEPSLRVVGEANDGNGAVKLTQKLKPDILLLDLAMPWGPGMEALRELSGRPNGVRTIVLTATIEKAQIVEALQLGARGVVLKESASEVLLKCIRTVMAGEFWLERETVSDLLQCLRDLTTPTEQERRRTYGLTARELEVVEAVVTGCTNKDIAQKFSLSEDTIKHHLTNIYNKLGVGNRLELALFAIDRELVKKI